MSFFPTSEDLSDCQRKNNLRLQEDLKARYYNAPDLEWVGKNGWRFYQRSLRFLLPTQILSARPKTTTRTCSCAPQRATP